MLYIITRIDNMSNMILSSAPEAVEIPDPISKWSTPKKILPIVTNKFKTSSQVLGEESDDSDSPKKIKSKISLTHY